MNTKKEKLLIDTYQSFMNQGLGRTNPDTLNEIVSKDIMGFGSTADEKIFGVEDLLKLLKIQKEQSEGLNMTLEVVPVNHYINSDENLAVFADDILLTVNVEGEKIKMYIRFSVVMEYTNNKWLAIHWHGSKPEDVQSEEDTFGIENWKQKVEKLERIVAERTADLVEKNRELEIEAALERIRAVAMSMMKPDDLLNICQIQFSELTKLGFTEIRNALIEIFNDEKKYFTDYDFSNFSGGKITQIPYHKNPEIDRSIKQMKSATDAFTEFVVKGRELEEWKAFRQKNGEYDDTRLKDITALYYYFYSVKAGSVGISTFKKISQEQLRILKRIRNVFDLAYQRYTDISLAEAQAREAQIEVALERVRARAMAMQHSEELADTASILFKQIKGLGFETWSCGFCTWKENDNIEVWMGADSGGLLPAMMIPYKKEPTHHDIYKASLTGADSHERIWEGKALQKHYDFLRTLPSVAVAIKQLEDAGLSLPTKQCYYVGFFKQGYLLLITKEANAELHDISNRFSKVFEQAYIRFLDLQKAELQAREAQIEVAVERVRAQSMAMHQTSDLAKVNKELLNQLLWLAVDGLTGVSIYFLEDGGETTVWDLSSPGNISDPNSYAFKFNSKKYPILGQLWQQYKKSADYFIIDYPLEKLQSAVAEFEEIDRNIANVVKEAIDSGNLKHQWNAFGKVAGGVIGIDLLSPPSEDTKVIVIKMAGAFNLAYKRFLDLQKAEAQAREAEIELALERVRARTMAMQHSDELADASLLLDQQVRGLGIKTRGCAFNIYGEKESTEWFSSEMGTMATYKTPREKVFLDYYETGQKGETFLTKEFSGKECVDWYNYLCTLPIMGDGLKQMIAAGGSFPTRQIDHVSFFKYGYLLFLTFEPVPEAHEIFKRFANVFEQTYTRFLDLQKAEAQTQKAEQDLIEIKKARKKAEETLVDLQSAQKQLIQSEKMASLGELTAGIAHEIQNPLNFVNNFSEVSRELLDEMKTELNNGNTEDAKEIAEDVIRNLEKINHHGKRADAIVKGMLQHSQSSTGKKEATDINALCDEYLRLSYHGLRAKDKGFNATMKTDFDNSIGNINIIPQDIGRVLLNLLTNAFYAVDEKKKTKIEGYEPTVSVSTKKNNGKIEIGVTDNGNGVPESVKEKIFQPFFTTKPTGQGTGLGLSLAFDIVTKGHSGELKVNSLENEGTTFIITIPITN